jgi:multiple sugar transport system ATP-binding protein
VRLNDEQKNLLAGYKRKTVTLGVRPEDVCEGQGIRLKVTTNENLGMNTLVQGYMGEGNRLTAKLRGWTNYKNGEEVSVQLGKMHFFDKETTNAIRKGGK